MTEPSHFRPPCSPLKAVFAAVALTCGLLSGVLLEVFPAVAQQPEAGVADVSDGVKTGIWLDVPLPLSGRAATGLIQQLKEISETAPEGQRATAVLRFRGEGAGEGGPGNRRAEAGGPSNQTAFEDALKLARAMTSSDLRRVRVVSLVEGTVGGHSTLPILASDLLLVGPAAEIVNASAGESADDDTIELTYEGIAKRRGLFPTALVAGLVDPGLEVAQVSLIGGEQVFASGEELAELRRSGRVLGEEVWSTAGTPLRINARQLRAARIAAGMVESLEQAAELLDLAELSDGGQTALGGAAVGASLELTGSIASSRARRWQSNLTATLQAGEVNTWVISIDSIGGSLDDSATLAGWFATPEAPLQTVAGWVRAEARGDAALIALACKPLYMQPGAVLGGPGAEQIDAAQLERYDELIDQIATATKRPAALIRGLLNTDLEVFRYTNQRTGRIRYATQDDIVRDAATAEDAEVERMKWQRGERIDLANGLTSAEAISLGLAEGESTSLEQVSRSLGLSGTPPPVADRSLVRFVERLGRNTMLSFMLLFIGFAALSAEANAPGLGFPGFIALVCFGLFFWMKFLAGTAEWLELVAFTLGLICLAIEVFVLPGFGVFGIGGLILMVLAVVLMSQTFVVPRNVYQLTVLTRGIWVALGGLGGIVGGFLLIRLMLPHLPMFRGLVMEAPDAEALNESEKLGDYGYLLGHFGVATTPLRPSGKARFDDQIVQVVSDGSSIAAGQPVRVCAVQATKVVVELVES